MCCSVRPAPGTSKRSRDSDASHLWYPITDPGTYSLQAHSSAAWILQHTRSQHALVDIDSVPDALSSHLALVARGQLRQALRAATEKDLTYHSQRRHRLHANFTIQHSKRFIFAETSKSSKTETLLVMIAYSGSASQRIPV